MAARRILIVEDEAPIRQMIAFNLVRAGFEVDEAEDVFSARTRIADQRPDLVLVDWMLPDASGLELTRAIKRDENNRDLAVIMLTAKAEEHDKIRGLEGGADDYITKPFSPRELVARVNAVLRRAGPASRSVLEEGKLKIDAENHRVTVGDSEIALGPTEYRLLKFLLANPERVYSRSQLLDRVWGANVYVEERTVDVHVRRLRKALTDYKCDGYIQTVRGSGYRFSTRIA